MSNRLGTPLVIVFGIALAGALGSIWAIVHLADSCQQREQTVVHTDELRPLLRSSRNHRPQPPPSRHRNLLARR